MSTLGPGIHNADIADAFEEMGDLLAIEGENPFRIRAAEIDGDTWAALPLALAAQPEDWTGPVDDVERDDLGYSETEMTGADGSEPLQHLRAQSDEPGSARRATAAAEEEGEPEGEDAPMDAPALERPVVPERT